MDLRDERAELLALALELGETPLLDLVEERKGFDSTPVTVPEAGLPNWYSYPVGTKLWGIEGRTREVPPVTLAHALPAALQDALREGGLRNRALSSLGVMAHYAGSSKKTAAGAVFAALEHLAFGVDAHAWRGDVPERITLARAALVRALEQAGVSDPSAVEAAWHATALARAREMLQAR